MTAGNSTVGAALEDRGVEPSDGVFRLAVAAVLIGVVLGPLAGIYAAGFGSGFVGGLGLATVDRRLPRRLGRTLGRQLALVAPGLLFLAVWLVPLEAAVDVLALWSVITVLAAGYALSQLARNRYVEAVTAGDPAETLQWDRPVRRSSTGCSPSCGPFSGSATSSPAPRFRDSCGWRSLSSGSRALSRRGGGRSVRAGTAVRFSSTKPGSSNGGRTRRRSSRGARSVTPWSEISHTRLREGELVLDRGLRDVRFDRDELEDLDAALEAIDRRLAAPDTS